MFEDKISVNTYEITRNDKQNSNSKLKAYFENSSFLAQQEELATFIKNLPIIRIDDLKSINKLIEVLIKQNEMIGSKCQQNFITIKEFYTKHDQLIKKNRNVELQLIQANHVIERNGAYHKQIDNCQEQINKLKQTLALKVDQIKKIGLECENLNAQNSFYHQSVQHLSEIIKLISQRNQKKCLEKVKQLHGKQSEMQLGWISWEQLETYLKEQKKRLKYYSKIKETVQIFCSRFLKISEFVPIQQVKDEFSKEVSNLLEILDDLLHLKKKNLLSSQSRFTSSGIDYNFFQGLLEKVVKSRQTNTITKEDITSELSAVKQQLAESKKHYEQYLLKIKMQYQETIRKAESQVEQKNHIIEFYQGEKEKLTKNMIQLKNRLIEFEETLKAQKHLSNIKQQEFTNLEVKLESSKSQFTIKQRQLRQQWQENIKTYEYKLAQKQELLEQEQKIRKNIRQQLEQKVSENKLKTEQFQEQMKKMNQSLKQTLSQNSNLSIGLSNINKKYTEDKAYLEKQLINKAHQCQEMSRRIQKQMTEIRHLQSQIEQNEKEKNLQSEYIKELQSKSTELLMKMKAIQSKKSEQKTAKKEINAIKQTIIEEKKLSRQMQENYSDQKQQNQRLKGIIKQMKKELQEVYLQFNHLKMIENDREKLISEIQKSDRLKQKLYQQFQLMKIDLIRIQQQKKTLAIEAKHYKNALSRIQALR